MSRKVCFIYDDGQVGTCIYETEDCKTCPYNDEIHKKFVREYGKPKVKSACKTCKKRDLDIPECPISHFGRRTRSIAEKTVDWCGCEKYEAHK